MPQQKIIDAMVEEMNVALWSIEVRPKEPLNMHGLFEELFRYGRQFNMSEMARYCGVARNSLWRVFRSGNNMRIATLIRLCYYMGLRLRIELDPVPRRLAYGSHHPHYKSQVDEMGAWDLGK